MTYVTIVNDFGEEKSIVYHSSKEQAISYLISEIIIDMEEIISTELENVYNGYLEIANSIISGNNEKAIELANQSKEYQYKKISYKDSEYNSTFTPKTMKIIHKLNKKEVFK